MLNVTDHEVEEVACASQCGPWEEKHEAGEIRKELDGDVEAELFGFFEELGELFRVRVNGLLVYLVLVSARKLG